MSVEAIVGRADAAARFQALPNGMRVVVRENRAAPVVALTLLVRVGSRDDTDATSGLTALLGRTLLKGTRARSALAIAQAAEDGGGALEVGTDQEYSEVRAHGLAREWRRLLELLHEVATEPAFLPDEVDRERALLLARIRALEDEPTAVANRLILRALYGTHGYGRPTVGETGTVSALGRDDLARHFARAYTPDRMVLAVAGAVNGGDVLAEAARLFGGLSRGTGDQPAIPAPAAPATSRVRERRPTEQTHLRVGVLAAAVGHPDHPALRVTNALLGGGMSSRLFRVLRDEAGLAYAVGSTYPSRRDGSHVVAHLGCAPSKVSAAEAGIRRELARLGAETVDEEELGRAKAWLTGTLALDLRTNARQAFALACFELMGVGYAFAWRLPELLGPVTAADVQRMAGRYLRDPAVVVVGPD